jgi:uncharacterized protein
MRVVITGSSGLIGSALRHSLEADQHVVIRLVRRPPRAPAELAWDPAGVPQPRLVDGADVVVNLAGATLRARRWTTSYQDLLRQSRMAAAENVAAMAAAAAAPPAVLISASGMRYYGVDRGDEILTEASTPGSPGFLPAVARDMEAAAQAAASAGIRVCHLRLGLVLSRQGGVLPTLLPLFRAGLGAQVGSGREYWSYVSLADAVRAVRFLATHPGTSGPYNITTPHPVRSEQFTQALAAEVGKRARLRVPMGAVRLAMGSTATEVFGSLRVVPARLTEAGFHHQHPDEHTALRNALSAENM